MNASRTSVVFLWAVFLLFLFHFGVPPVKMCFSVKWEAEALLLNVYILSFAPQGRLGCRAGVLVVLR